jgi:acetoin utilization protein AcuB
MEEFRVNVLPVINGREFLGLVNKTSVAIPSLSTMTLKDAALPLSRVFVYENQHVYDVAKVASLYNLDLVPVVNNEQEYSGLITVNNLVSYFAESKSVYMPGGIIVLAMPLKDYNMSRIAQIVESDDAHILSASVSSTTDPQQIEVTLKIDKVDISRILAGFYRHSFNVTGSYNQSEQTDDLKNRFDSLMHYLSIG